MTETMTIATILSDVSSMVTSSVGWVGSFMGVITSNPLLLMFCIVSFVGLGIGLLKRLMNV